MQIDIPSRVQFVARTKGVERPKWYDWDNLCFRHAVLRAVAGESVDVRLEGEGHAGCDDCLREASCS